MVHQDPAVTQCLYQPQVPRAKLAPEVLQPLCYKEAANGASNKAQGAR